MNELEVLKELERLRKAKSLPKELLKKLDIEREDIESVVLAFDECGVLEVGFVFDNSYDGDEIAYKAFDEVVKYLEPSIFGLKEVVETVNKINGSSTVPAPC
jgi:hypothetical protein